MMENHLKDIAGASYDIGHEVVAAGKGHAIVIEMIHGGKSKDRRDHK